MASFDRSAVVHGGVLLDHSQELICDRVGLGEALSDYSVGRRTAQGQHTGEGGFAGFCKHIGRIAMPTARQS